MAGPDTQLVRQPLEEACFGFGDVHHGVTELAVWSRRNPAAQRVGHELHAVAHAERHRARVALRRAALGYALRPARQDQSHGLPGLQRLNWSVKRQDLAVDGQLPQTARDELCELRTEIENENRLMWHVASGLTN